MIQIQAHPRRIVLFIFLLTCLCSTTGCSILLAKTGRYKSLMKNPVSKQHIHEQLGAPVFAGPMKPDGAYSGATEYEIYYLRGPVYDFRTEITIKMGVGMTYGLMEIWCFPVMLCERISGLFVKYTVTFVYRSDGSIRLHEAIWGRHLPSDVPAIASDIQ